MCNIVWICQFPSDFIYFLLKPNTLVAVARDLLNLAQNFRLSELCLCFRWRSGLEITVLCPFSSLVPITQVSLANQGLIQTHESDGRVLSGARLLTQPLCWGNQKLVCVSLKYPCFWSHSEGLLPVVLVLLLWKTDLQNIESLCLSSISQKFCTFSIEHLGLGSIWS